MGRGPKPAKPKVGAKPPVARKSSKDDGARVRDLEKRLAETLSQLHTRDRELGDAREQLTAAHAQVSESHEQQTATSEILRVISSSPTDTQPVFDAIAESATRLLKGWATTVFLLDSDSLYVAATHGGLPGSAEEMKRVFPQRQEFFSEAVRARQVRVIEDVEREQSPTLREIARIRGWRANLAVPMLREGQPIGLISATRLEPGPFAPREIELMKTFAEQAVIAIENVRLFTETKEALEQQTATAEILRVISSSPTDVQPVFDAIVRSASRLCGGEYAIVTRYDGRLLHLAAQYNPRPGTADETARFFPQAPRREALGPRAFVDAHLVHAPDVDAEDVEPSTREFYRRIGLRAVLAVPMIHEGRPIGVVSVSRGSRGSFSDRQIALLKTFADQAVIAIENVRLFNETKEALEQQTATSEILGVISQSPTDVQPVFEAIAASARRLCGGTQGALLTYDGALIHLAAQVNPEGTYFDSFRQAFPMTPSRASAATRAILYREIIRVPDVLDDPEYVLAPVAHAGGFRGVVAVPMLREGAPIGVIIVTRAAPGSFPDNQVTVLKTFADQAVIAIENVRLFKELEARNRDLTTALAQQTATSEILRVISSSPTDVQPVFEAIADSAMRLFGAWSVLVFRYDGEYLSLAAARGGLPGSQELLIEQYPTRRPSAELPPGQVILTRAVHHCVDTETDSTYPAIREYARMRGYRSFIQVPMLRGNDVLGVVSVTRTRPGAFAAAEVALLQTFADQAVIAIENVRLFTELQEKNRELTVAHAQVTESLDQQTATSEILRVIASSPTDVQPVFDAIASSAARLCRTYDVYIRRLDEDGLRLVAHHGPIAAALLVPVGPGLVSGRAVGERRTVHVVDVQAAADEFPEGARLGEEFGHRTNLGVPLLREGVPLGVIGMRRAERNPFTDHEIALLQTFADQAVIAIENVRLFTELQEKNQALTQAHAQVSESLEQQTATSEILSVISRSPTDVEPVFETITRNAVRLCDGINGHLYRFDGELVHLAAHANVSGQAWVEWQQTFPRPLSEAGGVRHVMKTGQVLNVADFEDFEGFTPSARALWAATGIHSTLLVPMMLQGQAIGAIVVTHRHVGAFSGAQVELLKTFATQAVIAIENVRLFTELQTRTQELTRSVGQLTALGEVGRAVSSTLDLATVLSTIVSRAIQLSGTDGGSVYEYDEATEEFTLRASRDLPEAYVEQVRDTRPRKGEGAVGRVAQTREPVQIADISDPAAYESRVRNTLLQIGLRALLAVPLIAEDRLVGALIVMRKRMGTFAAEEVALLQTFATQSALAIQNARLFREIEDKSRQLEVASQHKSEFLANMSHELRTPLNAIIGFSEVLSERMFGELNEKQEEYLKDIYASGTHLLSLINDILDLSKIEAGRMELELSDFHLPTALDSALTLVRERAGRRSIALHTNIDSQLGQIQADQRKVRQVVLNLLSNAIKFTPEGGRIEVGAVSKDGAVEISVRDTGIGIAPEDQEAVFEEFRQVGTADKKVEGTGLGLTLCRKFVELHGGKIWVKSEVDIGSTFSFTLPVRHGE